MRIHLGCDHAGFELVQHLVTHLSGAGHEIVNHGPDSYHPDDDYPAFCFATGQAVVRDPGSVGVVVGGSGNGEQIAANKVIGVRAALAWNPETARLARQHNNANIVAVGSRQHSQEEATALVEAFLAEDFSGDVRHQRRITQLETYERSR